jgi:hypothetical protein
VAHLRAIAPCELDEYRATLGAGRQEQAESRYRGWHRKQTPHAFPDWRPSAAADRRVVPTAVTPAAEPTPGARCLRETWRARVEGYAAVGKGARKSTAHPRTGGASGPRGSSARQESGSSPNGKADSGRHDADDQDGVGPAVGSSWPHLAGGNPRIVPARGPSDTITICGSVCAGVRRHSTLSKRPHHSRGRAPKQAQKSPGCAVAAGVRVVVPSVTKTFSGVRYACTGSI